MNNLFLKYFPLLFLATSLFIKSQNKEAKIDSLVIEMSLDPGSGPDFNLIKIYPYKNNFIIKYILYDEYNKEAYYIDPERRILSEKYKDVDIDKLPDEYSERLRKIDLRYTTFYTKTIKLKNKKFKDYLAELYRISKLSDKEIEIEKKKNSMYLHGIDVNFDFYKRSGTNKLYASALEKDNYKTLYYFLVKTLDLYRKQNQDKDFNSKTFGY